jgi:hypothetical protein
MDRTQSSHTELRRAEVEVSETQGPFLNTDPGDAGGSQTTAPS